MGQFTCQNCGQGCCTCSGCQQVTLSNGAQGCTRCQSSAQASINDKVMSNSPIPQQAHVGIQIQSITYTHNHTG